MHNAFRALGQQVGLQLVRGITPEGIDIFLNNAISEYSKNNIIQGVLTSSSEKGTGANSLIGPVNILRTLVRTREIKLGDYITNKPNFVSNTKNGFISVYIPTKDNEDVFSSDKLIDPMLYIACAIKYKDSSEKVAVNNTVTSRIVASDIVENALNDASNTASPEQPIVTLMCDDDGKPYFDIYLGSDKVQIESIIIKYIKTPNEVNFASVDCDLPSYTHYEIVRLAVQTFITTISGIGNSNNEQNNNK